MTSACTLVVCGAPLAARSPEIRAALVAAGWRVGLIATQASDIWLAGDQGGVSAKPVEDVDAVVVAPITFNTTNKLAGGIADTPLLGYLCEALGAGVPIVAVPTVNNKLWRHPAWDESTRKLTRSGVTFLDVHTGRPGLVPVVSGTGDAVVSGFEPQWIVTHLTQRVSLTA